MRPKPSSALGQREAVRASRSLNAVGISRGATVRANQPIPASSLSSARATPAQNIQSISKLSPAGPGRIAKLPSQLSQRRRVALPLNRVTVGARVSSGPSKLTRAPPSTQSRHQEQLSTASPESIVFIGGHEVALGEAIGQGGFSTVYHAVDRTTNRKVAVKVFTSPKNTMERQLSGEVNLLKSLSGCQHVVSLLAHGVFELKGYMVLELGELDMRTVLKAREKDNIPLDYEFLRYWGSEVLKCVEAVHAHDIVHSDLKPANFVLVRGRLKIIDFGISDQLQEDTVGVHRTDPIGTFTYMAPETIVISARCARRDYRVTKASDMWACGCILYEMVYGRYPFKAATRTEYLAVLLDPNVVVDHPTSGMGSVPVPFIVHEVIRGCLVREPSKRLTASAALDSIFFTARSVDKALIRSVVERSMKWGLQLAASGRTANDRDLKNKVDAVWEKLIALNGGGESEKSK